MSKLISRRAPRAKAPVYLFVGAHPLEIAVAYFGDTIGPEVVRRVRAGAGGRILAPWQWGRELVEEQRRALSDTRSANVIDLEVRRG